MIKNPVSLDSKMTHKYDDIINMEYPLKRDGKMKHPNMSIEDRAKIFAPFAALKGYEEAIAAKQRIVVPRIELSEESRNYLDEQLARIDKLLSNGCHPVITIVYFVADKEREEGEYIQFTGMVAKYNLDERMIQLVNNKFKLDDIYSIEGEDLDTF